jgi:transposase
MSDINYTSTLLNLKDPNLDFSDSHCEMSTIKGIETMVITAVLRNKPEVCPHCGDRHINVHGYKTANIKIPPVSEYSTILRLKKQRYLCKSCRKTFMAETSVVQKNCFISNNTKLAVANIASQKISEKDIALRYNISHNTVNRVINSFYEMHKVNYSYLPEALCFDEFKSTKDANGAMSFIFADAYTHKVVDIVEDRRLYRLEKYFFRFKKEARNNVKFVVMDMYSPYISLVKKCFPNARIIFDRFHIVNLLSRALNKTRIKVMNNKKELYNKFKNYYKLLLKPLSELDRTHLRHFKCFNKFMTQYDIVNFLLEQDEELKASYFVYQNFLSAIKYKDIFKLENLISKHYNSISDYMKTALATVKKYRPYIINAVRYNLSNGLLEGINNKIKTIKRIAFGYRSFYNFKNRILIACHLIGIKNVA